MKSCTILKWSFCRYLKELMDTELEWKWGWEFNMAFISNQFMQKWTALPGRSIFWQFIMCQFFLFSKTSINIIKNMEIFLSSETTETTNWFSNITMLHLLMTHILLLNVILISGKTHTNWWRTLKEALLQKFREQPFHAIVCLSWHCQGGCLVLKQLSAALPLKQLVDAVWDLAHCSPTHNEWPA